MPQKRIIDFQLRDNFTADVNAIIEDSAQAYRVTGQQILDFIRANISLPTTGDVKLTLKTAADSGWVLMNDGTIGNSASSATTRANADTEALFTLLWNNVLDASAPVSGGRGANAAADFAANKTIKLSSALGRAIGISGAGAGLTSRALGSFLGAETHQLTESEMPIHTHVQNTHAHGLGGHVHGMAGGTAYSSGAAFGNTASVGSAQQTGPNRFTEPATGNTGNQTASNQNTGGDEAHNNMQPTIFMNAMIKL